MKTADKMRAKSFVGAKRAAEEAMAFHKKEEAAKKSMIEHNHERARQDFPKILAEVEQAADKGLSRATIFIGEQGTYTWYYKEELKKQLEDKGFTVDFSSLTHEPVGSDPYRYDTYTDCYVEISW